MTVGMRKRILEMTVATLAIVLNGIADASAATAGESGSARAACAEPPAALGKFQASPPGKELPTVPWVEEGGGERPVSELRGKGLVLNFWATWCAPCVKEMPALDRLAKQAEARGFRVLALSADREGAAVVRQFYGVNSIGTLAVALDKPSRVARATGIGGLPTTVLYGAAGHEVGRVVGVAEWDAPAVVTFLAACLASES